MTTIQTSATNASTMMDAEVSYHALEAMRRHNFEVQRHNKNKRQQEGQDCQDHDHPSTNEQHGVDRCCATCLLLEKNVDSSGTRTGACRFAMLPPCIGRFLHERRGNHQYVSRIGTKLCLVCGSPVCARHTSQQCRQQGSTICLDCVPLLDVAAVEDCLSSAPGCSSAGDKSRRKALINRLIETYDRLLLRLKCHEPYLQDLACHLAANDSELRSYRKTYRRQRTSSIGFLSESMADWILSIYGLLQSILLVTGTALTRTSIRIANDAAQRSATSVLLFGDEVDPALAFPTNEGQVEQFYNDRDAEPSGHRAMSADTILYAHAFRRFPCTPTIAKSSLAPLDKARALLGLWRDLEALPPTVCVEDGCQIFLSSLHDHEHELKVQAVSRFLSALDELSGVEPKEEERRFSPPIGGRDSVSSVASFVRTSSSAVIVGTTADPILLNEDTSCEETFLGRGSSQKRLRRGSATSFTSVTSITSSSSSTNLERFTSSDDAPTAKARSGDERDVETALRNDDIHSGRGLSLLERIALHKQQESPSSFSASFSSLEQT